MFTEFETLFALARFTTLSRTAAHLRISQSAVTKRLQRLEALLQKPLTRLEGRRLTLTPFALHLVTNGAPLLSELRTVLEADIKTTTPIRLQVARGILGSWGPAFLARCLERCPELALHIDEAAGPEALLNLMSGRCNVALLRGSGETAENIETATIGAETMVIVPSRLQPFSMREEEPIEVMSLPSNTETMRVMARAIPRLKHRTGIDLRIVRSFESAAVLTQMARAGFGHVLVPKQVPLALGVSRRHIVELPPPGLTVPLIVAGNKRMLKRAEVVSLIRVFTDNLPDDI